MRTTDGGYETRLNVLTRLCDELTRVYEDLYEVHDVRRERAKTTEDYYEVRSGGSRGRRERGKFL